MLDSLWQGTTLEPRGQMKNVPPCFALPTSDKSEEAAPSGMVVSGKGSCHIPVSGAPECPGEKGRWQGRRIRGFEGARHPLNMEVHPPTDKSIASKWKENLMKHRFKQIPNKVMVVLTLTLGLYLCKTAIIYHSAMNWTTTSGKAPPHDSTILHPWTMVFESNAFRIVSAC